MVTHLLWISDRLKRQVSLDAKMISCQDNSQNNSELQFFRGSSPTVDIKITAVFLRFRAYRNTCYLQAWLVDKTPLRQTCTFEMCRISAWHLIVFARGMNSGEKIRFWSCFVQVGNIFVHLDWEFLFLISIRKMAEKRKLLLQGSLAGVGLFFFFFLLPAVFTSAAFHSPMQI